MTESTLNDKIDDVEDGLVDKYQQALLERKENRENIIRLHDEKIHSRPLYTTLLIAVLNLFDIATEDKYGASK